MFVHSDVRLIPFRYVLLKERNMIMTMEEEYKREAELFPNPERLEKVRCFYMQQTDNKKNKQHPLISLSLLATRRRRVGLCFCPIPFLFIGLGPSTSQKATVQQGGMGLLVRE